MGRTIKRLFFLHRVWRTFFAPLISIFSLQNSLKQMRINRNRKDSMMPFWSSCEFTNEKVYSEWYLKQEFWLIWTRTCYINLKQSPTKIRNLNLFAKYGQCFHFNRYGFLNVDNIDNVDNVGNVGNVDNVDNVVLVEAVDTVEAVYWNRWGNLKQY